MAAFCLHSAATGSRLSPWQPSTFRDVPDDVYSKIRALARSEGRSLNAQVIRLLTSTARGVTTALSVENALVAARTIREAGKTRPGASGLKLLHDARRLRERR